MRRVSPIFAVLSAVVSFSCSANAQLAVGEITGTSGPDAMPFHGYVALLHIQPFLFTPVVRHSSPECAGGEDGFASLVTTSDWGNSVGAYLAINGSFSLPENGYKPGDCLQMIGPVKTDGHLLAPLAPRPDAGGNPALLFGADGVPSIKMAVGADVAAAFNVVSGQWQTCQVPGAHCMPTLYNGTLLISQGQNLGTTALPAPYEVTGRTAVGLTTDSILVIVAVEENQDNSKGISLPALAEILLAFGANDAVNFDGGGSTTMDYTPSGTLPLAEDLRLWEVMQPNQPPAPSTTTFSFKQLDPRLPFASRASNLYPSGKQVNKLYRAVVNHWGFRIPAPPRRPGVNERPQPASNRNPQRPSATKEASGRRD